MKHVKKNKTSCSFSPPSYSRSKPPWTQRFLKQAWGSFGFNWCPVWLFWETVCMWMKWKPLEITSAVPCGRAGWGHLLKETIFSVILNCIRWLCTESKSQKYTTEPRAKEALPEYLHKAMLRFYNYNRKSALDYKEVSLQLLWWHFPIKPSLFQPYRQTENASVCCQPLNLLI